MCSATAVFDAASSSCLPQRVKLAMQVPTWRAVWSVRANKQTPRVAETAPHARSGDAAKAAPSIGRADSKLKPWVLAAFRTGRDGIHSSGLRLVRGDWTWLVATRPLVGIESPISIPSSSFPLSREVFTTSVDRMGKKSTIT
jgi:hypothetical protein